MGWAPIKLKTQARLLGANQEVLHECTIYTKGQDWRQFWRWECSCSKRAHGRSQAQSPYVSVFQWFRHAWRAEGMPWPKNSGPAHFWLKREEEA